MADANSNFSLDTLQSIYKNYSEMVKKDNAGLQHICDKYQVLVNDRIEDLIRAKYDIIANLSAAIETKLKMEHRYLQMFTNLTNIVEIYCRNGFASKEVQDFVTCTRAFFFDDTKEIFNELDCIDIKRDNVVGYSNQIAVVFSNGKVVFNLEFPLVDLDGASIFDRSSYYGHRYADDWTRGEFYDGLAKMDPTRGALEYELPALEDQISALYSKFRSIGMHASYYSSPHCIDSILTEVNPERVMIKLEEFLLKMKSNNFSNIDFS